LGRLFFRVINQPKEGNIMKHSKRGGFKVKSTSKAEHEFGKKKHKKRTSRKRR
jgi:hypothetical protein